MNYKPHTIIDSHISASNDTLTWRPLRQFNLYRLALSIGFIAAYFKAEWMSFLGSYDASSYVITAAIMLLSSIVYIFFVIKRKPSFETQVIISNSTDILLITFLAHYSGGISSSLSILLIINVTATGTFLKDRDSYLFAALASIAVLTEQTYSLLSNIGNIEEYSHAGLLGIVFFATSFLASILSKGIHESEQLAIEREANIISLEILNEDIIQNMRTGIIVVDHNGSIRTANSSAEALLGGIALSKNPLLKNIFPALNTRFIEWQEQPNMHHKAIPQEHGLPDIQPGFRKLQQTDQQTSLTLIFLEDATQLNLRFQQIKLASLGRLTASIAHEIRNPLSAINHAAQLLQEAKLKEADATLTEIITTQVKRLDKIINNVLDLSKSKKNDNEIIQLNLWLPSFCNEVIKNNNISSAQLSLDAQDEDISVLFDSSHLNQVMTNLCNNALTHCNLDRADIKINISFGYDSQSDQPYINVKDNGTGIPPKIIEQIFDPFFTTSSKGTGLGLYITKEIIESNRGRIRYISQDIGGYFKLHLLSGNHSHIT